MRTLLKVVCCLLAGLVLMSSDVSAHAAADPVNVLLVTGFDHKSHVWKESTDLIQDILEKTGRFQVSVSTDKEVFASPSLGDYGAVVLCFGFWEEADPSDEAKAGLLNYVSNGGNVVALHFACSSFQGWSEYGELLGRVWKKGVGGHGPYGDFLVNIKSSEHPITRGIEDFQIQDELYAKLTGDEQIEVLASAYSDWSMKVEPIVFVKRYGKGRVVHNVLGHGLDSKQHPVYQKLLARGVEWAATGEVTLE